jgi:hypothetical protein
MAEVNLNYRTNFTDGVSSGAASAAANMSRLADAFDKTDQVAKRAGPSFETVERRLDAQVRLISQLDSIERRYQQTLATVDSQRQRGLISLQRENELVLQSATLRDQQVSRSLRQAEAQASVTTATAADIVSQTAHQRALALSTKAANDTGTAITNVGLAAKLGYVNTEILRSGLINIGQSLAAGEGAARTFTTQLTQMAPAIPALVRGLGGISVATVAGAAGVAALGTGLVVLGSRALETDARLRQFNVTVSTLGTGDGKTAAGLEQAVRDLRDMGVEADKAATAVRSIAVNPALNPAAAGDIAKTGVNLGAALGLAPEAGIERLSTALSGTVDDMIKLGNAINAFGPGKEAFIRGLDQNAQKTAAMGRAYDDVATRLSGRFRDTMSQARLDTLAMTNAWNGLLDKLSDSHAFATAAEALRTLLTIPGSLTAAAASQAAEVGAMPFANDNSATRPASAGAPSDAASTALQYFINKGLTINQASGVVARLQGESGLDPNNVNPSSGAYGIAQWLGSRKPAAIATGGDFQSQLDLIWNEFQTSESKAFQALISSVTPTQAANAMELFERAGNPSFTASTARAAERLAVSPLNPNGTPTDRSNIAKTDSDLTEQNTLLQQNATLWNKSGIELQASTAAQEAFNRTIKAGGTDDQAMVAAEQARVKTLGDANAETNRGIALDNVRIATSAQIVAGYQESYVAGQRAEALGQAQNEVYAATGNLAANRNLVETRYKQILSEQAVAQSERNARDMLGYKDTQEALQTEIALTGQGTDQVNYQLTILRAKQQIERDFPLLSQREKDARLANVTATADLVVKLQEVQREQQRVDQLFVSIGNVIDQGIGGQLEKLFSGESVERWGTVFKRVLGQVTAQIASVDIVRPLIGQLLQFVGASSNVTNQFGTLSSIFGGSSSGGQVLTDKNGNVIGTLGSAAKSGFDLFGDLFGGVKSAFSGIGSSLGFGTPYSSLADLIGVEPSALSGIAGAAGGGVIPGSLFGSLTLGGAFGLAGLGGTAGSLLGLLTGNTGIGSTILGGAGGLVGGLAGSSLLGGLLGAAAGPLGAIGGGVTGKLRGDLFGAANDNPKERAAA